ncbi:MAG: hypothetical protein KGV44_08440 [Flavobacteriaceae bacterium]|nr:hypothetical protein [Flavobacteriaceae bacterium]
MKKNFLFLVIILLGCSNKPRLHNAIDLKKINLHLDVKGFYQKDIVKNEKIIKEIDILDEKRFGDKSNQYSQKEKDNFREQQEELLFEKCHTIKVDTIYKKDFSKEIKDIVGIQYNMSSWSNGEKLAYYNDMYFETIEMIRSANNEFMALVAQNESPNENAFKKLLSQIESENGKAKVKKYDFFGTYYVYFWELEDRLLAISSKYDNKESTLELRVEKDKNNSLKVDATKHPSMRTYIFILSNTFKKKEILGKLSNGGWGYFNEILEEE